ncbi:MAG TPA: MFS transporter [Thermoleophilaceae bacterium]|nr:MFS transporter [Thermoleophilaceae bacterium]
MDSSTTPTGRATRREWIGLAVLALPCMLITMDQTVLYLAVPALTADLDPSASQVLWITDVYGFLIAGALVTMGTLGDRIGRRRLLLIGGAAFGAVSVLAAFSTSAAMLIAARALLGVAGATLMPSTLSLIRTMFADPGQRTTAIGVWAASLSAGAAAGPLLGGALLEVFWWGSVFLLNVPVMALLLVLGPRLLPESRDPAPGRFDLLGAAQSVAAALALIYAVKSVAGHGAGVGAAVAAAAGVALGAVFLRRQARVPDSMLDLRLFRSRAFSAALATNFLGIFAILGVELFVARYLQLVLGLSPLEAGLWTLPSAVALLAGSTLAPVLAARLGAAPAIVGGSLTAAAGFALMLLVGDTSGPALVASATVVVALGIAPALTLSTDMIVSSAPPERAGAASALSETGTEFGGAMGIALLGSLGTAVAGASTGALVPGMHAAAVGAGAAMLAAAWLAWRYLRAGSRAPVTAPSRPATA